MLCTKSLSSCQSAVILGALILFTSSCSYKQNQVLFENAAISDVDQAGASALYDYKIETQDILQMRNLQDINYIYNVPGGNTSAISGSVVMQAQNYQVENDSTVALPVIGKVKVAGLTKLQAASRIQALYAGAVLKDPIIELKIVNLKVSVFGEVKLPGSYMLTSDKTNLIDLLAQAGGLTDKADEKQIKVVRGGMINPRAFLFDLNDFKSVSNPAIVLQSKDVIYVSQNKRALKNEKIQEVSTIVQPGLLLLNTVLIIFTLARK